MQNKAQTLQWQSELLKHLQSEFDDASFAKDLQGS
jgi:hypothetical protein